MLVRHLIRGNRAHASLQIAGDARMPFFTASAALTASNFSKLLSIEAAWPTFWTAYVVVIMLATIGHHPP
jgi:hypothetical protein